MHDAIVSVPDPVNEPVLSYAPGSTERKNLKFALGAIERGGSDRAPALFPFEIQPCVRQSLGERLESLRAARGFQLRSLALVSRR